MLIAEHRIQDVHYRIYDTQYMQDAGLCYRKCLLQDVGYAIEDTGFFYWIIGYTMQDN